MPSVTTQTSVTLACMTVWACDTFLSLNKYRFVAFSFPLSICLSMFSTNLTRGIKLQVLNINADLIIKIINVWGVTHRICASFEWNPFHEGFKEIKIWSSAGNRLDKSTLKGTIWQMMKSGRLLWKRCYNWNWKCFWPWLMKYCTSTLFC